MSKNILTPADLDRLGGAIGGAMAAYRGGVRPGSAVPMPAYLKEASLTAASHTIYGRYSIFGECQTGDLLGLQVQTNGLLNWIGWRPNKYYSRRVDFLTYIGPDGTSSAFGTDANPSTGAGAPCDDPTGSWEFGTCGYTQYHTSWYQRHGDALTPHQIMQDRCETSPRVRVDGTLITDDLEWQANGILNVIQMDILHDVIYGSHNNSYQMDGLEAKIKTGYTGDNGIPCPVDSTLVNWNYDGLDGAVNGYGNFFDYLDEVINDIEYRASRFGIIAENDMILLTTRFMATCLLDSYACYTTCGVTDSNDVTDQALRAQQVQYRMSLNGGPLYDGATAVGFIHLKSGRRIPIMVDDMMEIEKGSSTWCTDIYILTRRIGTMDVLYGEYLDTRTFQGKIAGQMATTFKADAGGRFLFKGKEDNFCVQLQLGTSPELYLSAPWAQARISNVCCGRKRTPISGNPYQPQYMPGGRPLYAAGHPHA